MRCGQSMPVKIISMLAIGLVSLAMTIPSSKVYRSTLFRAGVAGNSMLYLDIYPRSKSWCGLPLASRSVMLIYDSTVRPCVDASLDECVQSSLISATEADALRSHDRIGGDAYAWCQVLRYSGLLMSACAIAMSIHALFNSFMKKSRIAAEQCINCGYSRRGLPGGKCPECGN